MNLSAITHPESYVDVKSFRFSGNCVSAPELEEKLKKFPVIDQSDYNLELHLCGETGKTKGSYHICIRKEGGRIVSSSLYGIGCGLDALIQIYLSAKCRLPLFEQNVVPAFESRGIMLDVSRGKMPKLEYLKNLAEWMSQVGYNILQLYCEDKLRLQSHPEIGTVTGAYTGEQIRDLDKFCTEHSLELQPCIQTYSHLHGILRLPGYSCLSENDTLFSFAAGNESVYRFLEDEFAETLSWFTSKTLNINMDEAYDIGSDYSKKAVEEKGQGEVFLDHMLRVIDIARGCGAETIILWGDIVSKYPDLLPRLPENVIVADWCYNPMEHYPSLIPYQEHHMRFWAAGGVSTWNSIFPRIYNSYINLIGFSSEAKERGAEGFLVTDWGDYGHAQPLGLSLYGYFLGGIQSVIGKPLREKDFEKFAGNLIFCDEREEKAFRLLMDSNLAPGIKTGFKTMTIYAFFDDLLDGLSKNGNENYPAVTEEACRILLKNGSEALELLQTVLNECLYEKKEYPDESWKTLFGKTFLEELKLSAEMTAFTGKKGLLGYQILHGMASDDLSPDMILGYIRDIHLLYAEFQMIRRNFEHVWELRAYRTGIESCLSCFDRAGVQMFKAVKWLAEQRINLIRIGRNAIKKYTGADDYGILWTGDFKNMWDRAYPWH